MTDEELATMRRETDELNARAMHAAARESFERSTPEGRKRERRVSIFFGVLMSLLIVAASASITVAYRTPSAPQVIVVPAPR